MDSEFIQVRLTRETRARLRDYAYALKTRGLKPANPANRVLSPEECVARLLDQWARHQERSRKSRKQA